MSKYEFQSFSMMDNGQSMVIPGADLARHLRELSRRKGVIHLVGMLSRPGAPTFLYALEHTYFPPNTKRNEEFELRVVKWADLMWFINTIPKKCERFALRAADKTGMVLRQGRIPVVIDGDGQHDFPFRAPELYLLENRPDSDLYKPGGEERLRRLDRDSTDRISDPTRN